MEIEMKMTLTKTQMKQMVEMIEEQDNELEYEEFSERVGMMLEDVSGCEYLEENEIESVCKKMFNIYITN